MVGATRSTQQHIITATDARSSWIYDRCTSYRGFSEVCSISAARPMRSHGMGQARRGVLFVLVVSLLAGQLD